MARSSAAAAIAPSALTIPRRTLRFIALREAGLAVGNYRLLDCDLYVTVEPCAMCAGAITHARIRRLIYGAEDPKAGAVHSMLQVLNHPKLNHQVDVTSGVLAARCMDLLQTFFRERRAAQRAKSRGYQASVSVSASRERRMRRQHVLC